MSKGFSKNNPLEKLSGTTVQKNTEMQKKVQTEVEPTSASPDPQRSKDKPKKGQKYLSLDITGYQGYISLMAEYEKNKTGKYVSQTQYILRLIEADKQKNLELYEKLEQIEKMKQELV